MHNIGMLYFQGVLGRKRDYITARKWFKKAVQGKKKKWPYYFLGVLYYRGLGVAKSNKQALKWFLLTSKMGIKEAHIMIIEIRKKK